MKCSKIVEQQQHISAAKQHKNSNIMKDTINDRDETDIIIIQLAYTDLYLVLAVFIGFAVGFIAPV